MKNKGQYLKTGERRVTRSTNNVPLNLLEKPIDNAINLHCKTTDVVLEDGGNSFSKTLKIIKNKRKDEVVARLNINIGSAVTAPLNCREKVIKGTCDIYITKRRKRGSKQSFWENKLTGARRISKRLKNIKIKKKELESKQTNTGLYTYCKKSKMTSGRKSAHNTKININSNRSLSFGFPGSNKSSDEVSNSSSNPKSGEVITEVNIDIPAMIVEDNSKLTLTEDVKTPEDNIIMAQCPDDSEILKETTQDNESSSAHDDGHETVLAIKDNMESEDVLCEECIESVLEIESSGETQSQIDVPSEGEISVVNTAGKVSEDAEKNKESSAEAAKIEVDLSSPKNDG